MKILIVYLSLASSLSISIYAQEAPVKFGEVSMAQMLMKSYSLDTIALAFFLLRSDHQETQPACDSEKKKPNLT